VTLIDGNPFFPIAMYAVWKNKNINVTSFEQAFSEQKEAGFNAAHTYNRNRTVELEEFYATAQKYGFKIIIAGRPGANNKDPGRIVEDIVREYTKPALMAWYLADDTAGHISISELAYVHRIVEDLDPYHLTVQADAVGSPSNNRYRGYVDSTDVFLPELYPIRSDENCEVARIIQDMQTVYSEFRRVGYKRPVWAIVQDFEGWGWKRFPTNAEARAMTYLSIIHGATGMTYYTYGCYGNNHGAPYDKEVWTDLKKIAGELAQLHDVLVGPLAEDFYQLEVISGPLVDNLGYPSVSTLLKGKGKDRYLFTASSKKAPLKVKFLLEDQSESIEVMFENRNIKPEAGVFTDNYTPYEVHIYHWVNVQ